MRFAGIGWSESGFDVVVVDERAEPAAGAASFPAGQGGRLVDHLVALDRPGNPIVCVVDSTNGMVDGGLMSAGLRVHRADPRHLPPRTRFGSVDAGTLARTAATRLDDLPRLHPTGGSVADRLDEHSRHLAESRPVTDALTEAGRCLYTGRRDERDPVVALTFDDGPHPPYTERILDILDRYDVPATFFCVGSAAGGHSELLWRMAEAGHRLGNHSWSHPFPPDVSVRELAEQIRRTDEVLAAATGRPPTLFRPPYGGRTRAQSQWLLRQAGGPTLVLWDVNPHDWTLPGAGVIARRVLADARPGSVVLLHDGGGERTQTAAALPAVIEGLLGRGYRFAPVDRLLPPAG